MIVLPEIVKKMRGDLQRDEYGKEICGLPVIICSNPDCHYVYGPESIETVCPKCGKERARCRNHICTKSRESGGDLMCHSHFYYYNGILKYIIKNTDHDEKESRDYISQLVDLVEETDESGIINLEVETQQAKMTYALLMGDPDIPQIDKLKGFKDFVQSVKEINNLIIQQNIINSYIEKQVVSRLNDTKAISFQFMFSLMEKILGEPEKINLVREALKNMDPQAYNLMQKYRKTINSRLGIQETPEDTAPIQRIQLIAGNSSEDIIDAEIIDDDDLITQTPKEEK
jgi:hypothetical protein